MGQSGWRPSRTDRRGQSEVIAVVLLLGLTVIGTGTILVFGSEALAENRDSSHLQSTEHAMTLFDSRSAMVALGESGRQTVDLGGGGDGTYEVADAGKIEISHLNYTGEGHDQTIYEASLGSLAYVNGDTTVAYEGGGVWRKRGDGAVMVSPPEFHYRDSTLTLPVIRTTGSGAAAGATRATVSAVNGTTRIYPNESKGYADAGRNFTNPVENGRIEVAVQSDYYRGWADYFRARTDGNVSVDAANRTAAVELTTVETVGQFEMPREGNSVKVRSVAEEHPLHEFEVTLHADNAGRNFENLHWSLYADEGPQEFELHVHSDGKCKGSGEYDGELDVSVYYSDDGDSYQGWQNRSIDPSADSNFDVDCDNYALTADLGGSTALDYGAIDTTGSDNKWRFGPEIEEKSLESSATFDQHGADDDTTYDADDSEETGHLVGHYFALLGPDFDLTVSDGPGDGGSERIDETSSYGTLEYEQGGGRYITFLHVTENEVRVEFE